MATLAQRELDPKISFYVSREFKRLVKVVLLQRDLKMREVGPLAFAEYLGIPLEGSLYTEKEVKAIHAKAKTRTKRLPHQPDHREENAYAGNL